MPSDELQLLIQKRGQLKASLTRFSNFLKKFDENKKIVELQTRLDKVESIWSEFENIQFKIELLSDSVSNESERETFENDYFEIISHARQILLENENVQNQHSFHDLSTTNLSHNKSVRLQILDLPKYYGEYSKWLYFRDTFTALVHSDKSMNDVTKFHYLKSCLKGDAEQILDFLDVTEENYKIAWDILHERFENKKVIKRSHLRALFEWPSITHESHTHLRKMLDGLSQHVAALHSLGEPTDHWDSLLIFIFANKLDHVSSREWENSVADKDSPTLTDFKSFLSKRCHFLESFHENTSNAKSQTKTFQKKTLENRSLSHAVTLNAPSCYFCKEAHHIYKCQDLLKLPVKSRIEEIKKLNLCTNCLRSTHTSENCTSGGCKHCGRKHNTILHIHISERASNTQQSSNTSSSANVCAGSASQSAVSEGLSEESRTVASLNTHCSFKEKTEILLATALVNIFDRHGNPRECRVLLDSGSQSNFIRSDLCDILQLNRQPINVPVVGINQAITNISYRTNATIQSKSNGFNVNLPFLVLDKITDNLPVFKINTDGIKIPNNIVLADPTYHSPGKIDLLIGASVFFELLSIGQIKLGEQQPVLQKTKLGWILSGSIPCDTSRTIKRSSQSTVCNFSTNVHSIEDQIEKFWHLENINQAPQYSREEMECEEYFLQTTRREPNGHFVVSLPIRDDDSELGDSYQMALKRFNLLEKKLSKNEELKNQYTHFIKEYQDLGHMSLANTSNDHDKFIYYLPHHSVYKHTSSTTKLRVVFDASAKSETGVSLNDKLKIGPTIQEDLLSILLRFRKHNFVIVADIEKMYRQVFVQDHQRDLQRILWRPEIDQPLQHFRLNTLTYGTASAAFLATRCLHQVGIENQSSYPLAGKVILSDFYVDDLLTGTDSVDSARRLKRDLTKILENYGFPLRKWASNNRDILEEASINSSQITTHFISDDKTTKTLGLLWNPEIDIFQYTVNKNMIENRTTKRTILSVVSQIFDPLGLLGPTVIKAKIIIQKLWQLKLNWDEAIPADLHTIWTEFYHQIHYLNDIKIPRHVICFNPVLIQVHSFCDASERAYGVCVYIRSTDTANNHSVRLLSAKSRVAPLKNISLPRLELCGALLSAQLTSKIIKAVDMKINNVFYWTDSTITLAWISAEPSRWKTFVANRVSEIQELTEACQWKHISSNENPADAISRGVNPEQLPQLDLWWNGPRWLARDEESWPHGRPNQTDVPETRKTKFTLTTHNLNQDIFHRFSSFIAMQRVIALCLRFKKNLTSHINIKITGSLTASELNESLVTLIKLVQSNEFSTDIQSLNRSESISSKSKLVSLNPFLDEDGLIRVGGRLKNSDLSFERKHPIVLPSHHPFTKLLILHEHYRHLHAGAQATLYAVRVKYWPLNGRNTVRGVLRRCITCFKAKPHDTQHQMGHLPTSRLKPSRPFSVVGIDFAGPFFIKDGKFRNRKIVKCYVCVFVCFITKATHLELAGDLSTSSFLNALKRFVSRRGLCSTIHSDNGTNFVGANNDLNQIHNLLSNLSKDSKFNAFVSQNSITWNFIPPRSPHFGGIWEAAVKSSKYHLKRILGNANLTYEEFYTVLTQVEAVLNSRPLTPLSSDPNDFLALTPSHFLIGEPLTAVPQEDVKDIPTNRLSHYKRLQQLVQHFWKRWSNEYLATLHQRTKWKLHQPNQVQVGSMVLLKDENTPPLHWKIGRISELFPGQDGIVRVVNVKTCSGTVRRAVSKICILPLET